MRIAIDLDGTIFSCDSLLYKVANTFFSSCSQENLKYSQVDANEARTKSFLSHFTKILNYQYYEEVEDATNIIKSWSRSGHEIILLSSRPKWKALRSVVLTWLENFDVSFTMLVVACNNKAKFCKQFKIDILIDDTFSNCKKASDAGIKSIYLTESHGRQKGEIGNIDVADSWYEIDKCLDKLIQEKKQKIIDEIEK